MKLVLTSALCVLASAIGATESLSWPEWKKLHSRVYHPTEDTLRFKVFNENRDIVKAHNDRYEAGKETYTMSLNKFADLNPTEFAENYLNEKLPQPEGTSQPCERDYTYAEPTSNCPDCYDAGKGDETFLWNNPSFNPDSSNYVVAPKDQGSCGSCWSFAGTSILESRLCQLGLYNCDSWTGLSEQQSVDCNLCGVPEAGPVCAYGCGGGWGQNVWAHVAHNNQGINSEDDYAYASGATGKEYTCKYDGSKNAMKGAEITNRCRGVEAFDEDGTVAAIRELGPIKVSIYVSNSFYLYNGGVYTGNDCPNDKTNHAVVATGYGTDNGLDYYMVRNSWGPSWGMDGYIKFRRNYNSMCAIALYAYFPEVEL